MILRVQDLDLQSRNGAEKTFARDAAQAIRLAFDAKADVGFDCAPCADLEGFEADVVISPLAQSPVAVYFATVDARADEAVILWMENRYIQRRNLRVVLLLETEKPPYLSPRSLRRALNRLDRTLVFRGDEAGAIAKIASIAGVVA